MSGVVARRFDIAREVVLGVEWNVFPLGRAQALREVRAALQPYDPGDAVAWEAAGLMVVHVRLQTAPPDSALEKRFNLPAITFAERNRAMRVAAAPDDTLYGEQWALRRIGAEEAWNAIATPPANPVTVAVIDSGTATAHPDLASVLWTNPAPTVGDLHGARMIGTRATDGRIEDDDGHGTRLAGTIAAVTDNALGIASAGWPATIEVMTLKFFDVETPPTSAAAARAIAYAVDHGARVLNLSWDVGMPQEVLKLALEDAAAGDVLVVVAAGNDGTDNDLLPTWPANYVLPNLLSVMATDIYDERASFSDYGARTVHLAAPGVAILTTDLSFASPQYRGYGGTSAACALVTAAAALLRALNPTWSAALVREHLMKSVDVLPDLKCVSRGRLNLGRAVRGPLGVIVPRAGDRWRRNRLVPVEWRIEYPTPACETVEIFISDDGGATYGERLIQGMANDGACMVKAPDRIIARARLRIQSEQGHFHADSGVFKVQG